MDNRYYYTRETCRLCESSELIKVVSIGESPISEKYVLSKDSKPDEVLVPLDLYMCKTCGHIQLIHIVYPNYLWSNFTFKTSRNNKLKIHYETWVKEVLSFAKESKNNFVLDVGSNDGTLLSIFQKNGIKQVLGIDPAKEIAEEATREGIETIADFMGLETSKKIVSDYGKADLITANNVYAHVDDVHAVTDGIISCLDPKGLFVFEVSYAMDVIDKKLLGTIFHEHMSYHSLSPILNYLKSKNMEVVNVSRSSLQGGSLVCFAQHINGPYKVSQSVQDLLELEKNYKIQSPETLFKFSEKLNNIKNQINILLDELKEKNKSIAGFASSRAATTLIKYFDIADKIDFIVDDNEDKHNKFTPGSRIEVLPSEKIYEKKPDYLIIFAWEWSEQIIKKHDRFISDGGTFIKIFPELSLTN